MVSRASFLRLRWYPDNWTHPRLDQLMETNKRIQASILFCAVIYFFWAGWTFIPYLGLQDDEVIFAAGLYEPLEYEYGIQVFHRKIPLMLMTYLGATKTWFYGALFHLFAPTSDSV